MGRVDERSIGTDVDALRRELIWEWEQKLALVEAFRDLPEMAPPDALHFLSSLAGPGDWERGKALAGKYSSDVLPPNSECETGAGLWVVIRAAVVAARNAQGDGSAMENGMNDLLRADLASMLKTQFTITGRGYGNQAPLDAHIAQVVDKIATLIRFHADEAKKPTLDSVWPDRTGGQCKL